MATILALAQTDTKPRNDDFVTIFGSNDDGTIKMDDQRDQKDWNPPAFAAGSSARGLTFVVTNLPPNDTVTIKITNLCLPINNNTPPPITSKPVQVQPDPDGKPNTGKATVTFPADTDPVPVNILVAILKKIGQLIDLLKIWRDYHLYGQPDACSLFRADLTLASKPDSVSRTYYYYALGKGVNP